jgi:hypothetical protein
MLHATLYQHRYGFGAFVADHLADQGALEGCFSFRHGHSLFGGLLLGKDGFGASDAAASFAQLVRVAELLSGFLHAQIEMGSLQILDFFGQTSFVLGAQFSGVHCDIS